MNFPASFPWLSFLRLMQECHASPFMDMVTRRRREEGLAKGSMGAVDSAALYSLVRINRPRVAVETGTSFGASAAFILQAMHDAGVEQPILYSIDIRQSLTTAILVPEYLKGALRLISKRAGDAVASSLLPSSFDFFLHDSLHTYENQKSEFDMFWPRLLPGGILASHDINLNRSFLTFIATLYSNHGNPTLPLHAPVWGAFGKLGFVQKENIRE